VQEEVGGIVLHIGNPRIDEGQPADGVLPNPQAVPAGNAEAEIGDVHLFEAGNRPACPALFARPGATMVSPSEKTVADIHLPDRKAGNAPAIQADLHGAPPRPAVIVAATAEQPAVLDDSRCR